MTFFDRLSNERVTTLPESNDEWRFIDLDSQQIVLIENGKTYLPDSQWGDGEQIEYECVVNSVQIIAQNYRNNTSRSPLIPIELAHQSVLLDLEEALKDVLQKGHLHAIANRPRLDVHYQDNVVVLPRAKRLAKSALTHLSSHSDCWQRRTVTGILPRKILAEFSEDFYEIYENRLYKCLLDRLENYLTKRLRWVKYLKQNLEDFLNFQNSEQAHYRLRNRICALWGENYQNSEDIDIQLNKSKEAIDLIIGQLKIIQGLKQHGLYTKMPIYTRIPNQIHRTNILNHDEHYQYLPKLWDKLNIYQQDKLSLEQQKQWAIDFQHDYEDYIGLLIERAVENYNFDNKNKTFTFAGEKYQIKKEYHQWCIISTKNCFFIIPIANRAQIDSKKEGYLFCSCWKQENIVYISPMDLYVVERMAKEINIWLFSNLILQYNETILRVPQSIQNFAKKNIDFFRVNNHTIQIIKPLENNLRNELNILLKQYTNQEMQDLFESKLKNVEQIQNFCQCEQPNILFQPSNTGFFLKCRHCESIFELRNNMFNIGIQTVNGNPFTWAGRYSIHHI